MPERIDEMEVIQATQKKLAITANFMDVHVYILLPVFMI